MISHFLPLIGHNFLLLYYWFEYKRNFYKYCLYYTWVQVLLITLGFKMLLRIRLSYAWVQILLQMGPLLHFGPVITLVPSTA